jgi:hypothetical protein
VTLGIDLSDINSYNIYCKGLAAAFQPQLLTKTDVTDFMPPIGTLQNHNMLYQQKI